MTKNECKDILYQFHRKLFWVSCVISTIMRDANTAKTSSHADFLTEIFLVNQ